MSDREVEIKLALANIEISLYYASELFQGPECLRLTSAQEQELLQEQLELLEELREIEDDY